MADITLTITLIPIITILTPGIPIMDMGGHMAAILIQAILYLIMAAPTLIIMVLIQDITAMTPDMDSYYPNYGTGNPSLERDLFSMGYNNYNSFDAGYKLAPDYYNNFPGYGYGYQPPFGGWW